jgi:hypothetical protein
MIDLKEKAKQINELLQKRREVLGLTFEEEGHRYTMKDLNGVLRDDYPSVSSVLKNFYTPFPKEKKALSMAGGDVMEKNRLLNEWKLAGDKSINLGSRTHFYLEKSLIEQYGNYKQLRQPEFECTDDQIVRSDKMVEAGNKFIDLMHERGCVLLDTEIVLGDPVLGYTGQPDKMWLSLNKEKTDYGIICTDWKTNQEKNFIIQPYNKDHMLWPFNNYIDYTLTHYYVQIPLYARLVIEMLKNTDFENVKSYGGIIVLVKDDGTFNEYRVPADINKAVFSLDLSKYTKTNGYIK